MKQVLVLFFGLVLGVTFLYSAESAQAVAEDGYDDGYDDDGYFDEDGEVKEASDPSKKGEEGAPQEAEAPVPVPEPIIEEDVPLSLELIDSAVAQKEANNPDVLRAPETPTIAPEDKVVFDQIAETQKTNSPLFLDIAAGAQIAREAAEKERERQLTGDSSSEK